MSVRAQPRTARLASAEVVAPSAPVSLLPRPELDERLEVGRVPRRSVRGPRRGRSSGPAGRRGRGRHARQGRDCQLCGTWTRDLPLGRPDGQPAV